MVTYVFGAGASLHAGYPLTAHLGDNLHDWARQNDFMRAGYIEEFHEQCGERSNFEQVLTQLYERPADSWAATLNQTHCGGIIGALAVAIPEFFSWVRQKPIDGPDSYRELARHKIRGGDAILTFNYDLACERALRAEGLWEIGDGYGFSLGAGITPPSKVKVFKLHGSTNWLGILFDGTTGGGYASNVYGPRPCLFGERDFTYLGYSNDVRDPHCEHILAPGGEPGLILPTLHKDFFLQTPFGPEWKHFWNDIWRQAAQALRSAKKIVIIGYSMPTADERARELLLKYSNPSAEILVFSGSRTGDICKDFRNSCFQTVNSFGDGYFKDYLNA
jgi:hypothetical protein